VFGKHVLTAYNAARADELNTAFSKYPHLWDALATSSYTAATSATIEEDRRHGDPRTSQKARVGPKPTTLMT